MTYDKFFIKFANKERLRILYLLREGPLSVNQIVKELDQEQSTVSHNLRKLWNCNLLNMEKKGRNRVYSLNRETVIPILDLAREHVQKFCIGRCNRYEIQENLS